MKYEFQILLDQFVSEYAEPALRSWRYSPPREGVTLQVWDTPDSYPDLLLPMSGGASGYFDVFGKIQWGRRRLCLIQKDSKAGIMDMCECFDIPDDWIEKFKAVKWPPTLPQSMLEY